MKPRKVGCVFQPWYRDRKGEKRQASTWAIRYFRHGKMYQETGFEKRSEAERALRDRTAAITQGRLVGPDIDKTTMGDLGGMLLDDYRANERRSLKRVGRAVRHLLDYFGQECRAVDVTEDRISAFIAARRSERAANASINRELAALRRMFRLGERAQKVGRRPCFAMLAENNARKGFAEAPELESILGSLSKDLRPVIETAAVTGWRVASEILTRQWRHVDFAQGFLRLEPGEGKTGEGRVFPFTPDLRAILEHQRERTQALERETGRIIPWVFHRNGKPIRSFRGSWKAACTAAGVPDLIPHDLRRSAVRNLERAGVPRSAAMRMVGHRTESVYRRYAIVDEAMMREAADKLATLHASQRTAERKHVAFGDAATANRARRVQDKAL